MLNIVYLVFFLATFPFAMARNQLFGFYYAALYIYSAFAIAGYLYLPGISESLQAYFGNDVGNTALAFTFASMVAFWCVNMVVYRRSAARRILFSASHAGQVTSAGFVILGLIGIVFASLLAINFATLSWYIFEESDSLPLQVSVFIAVYKTMVGVLAVCYVIVRSDEIRSSRAFTVMYLLIVATFLAASVRLGNRTDPAALLIGIIMFEMPRRTLSLRRIAAIGLGVVVAFLILSAIEYYRYTDGGIQAPLLERIVRNDYYAPAHMLFAAVAFDFVNPITVLKSNGANALILFGQPYLQQTVTELFRSDVATRSAGYAFYILTEGWIFAGWGGILYNAIVPSLGLLLWNRIAATDNKFASLTIQTLVACMLLNVTRGQSSYFIKYLYTFVLPNLGLAMLIVRLRFHLRAAPMPGDAHPATAT